ncbi:TKL protein kinase, partial [Phytophthora megakarya]
MRRLDASSSNFPYAVVIGSAVGVLAVILVSLGLFFYCKERKRNKELALESYVNLAPNPPASQLSPGIAANHSISNGSKLLTGSMDAHAGFYVMTSPVNTSVLPPAVLKPTSHESSSRLEHQSSSFIVASDPSVQKPSFERSYEDTADLDAFDTSARSRMNSFEDHESYRRAMGYSDNSSSAQTANSNSNNNEAWP